MSTASTATQDYTVDQIIGLAMVTASVLHPQRLNSPPPEDLVVGRMWLFIELQALAARGIVLRARERQTVTLPTSGTAYVDLDSDTTSVERGVIVRNVDGVTDRELTPYSLEQYQRLPDKTVQSMPNFYYPEQKSDGTWRVYFYPVPDTDWPTAIIPRTRKLRDVEQGSVTIDLTPKWYVTIVNALAARFARSKGRRDLALELKDEQREEQGRVESDETTRGDTMLVIAPSPWDC